jgi:hypothetical protein
MPRKYIENATDKEKQQMREFRAEARRKLAKAQTDKEKLELLVDYVVGGTAG